MNESALTRSDAEDLVRSIQARTPARLLVGRAGTAYCTATQLELRRDHAAALDAVHEELNLTRDLGHDLIDPFLLFDAETQAVSKTEYLARPDLGRKLTQHAKNIIPQRCPPGRDIQVIIGDGLSTRAIASQVPALLPLLWRETEKRGWSFGRPFVVRHCRVGILNEVGELLDPVVAVLLIGERPGLATAESLSAYLAYRPRAGHSDAQRNLISNIHERGVSVPEAARRILALAENMRQIKSSGIDVKETAALNQDPASLQPGKRIPPMSFPE